MTGLRRAATRAHPAASGRTAVVWAASKLVLHAAVRLAVIMMVIIARAFMRFNLQCQCDHVVEARSHCPTRRSTELEVRVAQALDSCTP